MFGFKKREAPTQKPAEPKTTLDPVCGMRIPTAAATGHLEHAGRTIYFCSPGCQKKFRQNPERYAHTA